MESHVSRGRSLLAGLLGFLTAATPAAWAQSIPNPSFEADTYTTPPGYASDNGGITGWVLSDPTHIGLNPASGSLFADNGATPHGTNVAFVQSTGGASTLATTIAGLTPGVPYRVSFRANRRAAFDAPNPSWSFNGGPFVPFSAAPAVGGLNPYYTNSGDFTATNSTAALVIRNQSAGDATVLVDDFSITAIPTVVANTNDNGPGSLRQVIADAAGGATITFASNLSGSTIRLTTGELLLNKNLAIDASALPGGLRINGNRASRIFKVASNATMVLNSLTITNGYNAEGGGIHNAGTLTLNQTTLAGNSATGTTGTNSIYGVGGTGGNGNGGGIYNLGTLTMNQSTLSRNSATGGGGGGSPYGSGGVGGNGHGGGIYNAGTLTVDQCTLSGNSATGGGGGGGPYASGGVGGNGHGGGIYNAGTLTVDQCTLSANSAAGGYGGGGPSPPSFGSGGNGGNGSGGGGYNTGTLTMNQSALSTNSAAGGPGGNGRDNYDGAGGTGGAGGSGNGGSIFNAGNLTMNQNTVSGNSATGGPGGLAGLGCMVFGCSRSYGGNGGNGSGGGGYNTGTLTMNQSTLSANSVAGGPGGFGDYGVGAPGSAVGGGIYQGNALTLFNSIVAGNIPNEFFGAFTATGNNITNGNPLLAPLGHYGGPTKTRPPMAGSPAIDAGAATSFTNDQRGFPRPLGPAPDIGAVEGVFNVAIPLANLTRLANGTFQLAITSFSGPSHSVLAGTNVALPLNTWLNLGLAVELPPGSGQFQFTDLQATNYPQRFYRISVP